MIKTIYICDGCGKEMQKEELTHSYFYLRSFDVCKYCEEKLRDVKRRFEEMNENLLKEEEKIMKEELSGFYKKMKGEKENG